MKTITTQELNQLQKDNFLSEFPFMCKFIDTFDDGSATYWLMPPKNNLDSFTRIINKNLAKEIPLFVKWYIPKFTMIKATNLVVLESIGF